MLSGCLNATIHDGLVLGICALIGVGQRGGETGMGYRLAKHFYNEMLLLILVL